MEGKEGRGVLVYLLLDVASDEDANRLVEELAVRMGTANEHFVGYAVSQIEPIELTFEGEADDGSSETRRWPT